MANLPKIAGGILGSILPALSEDMREMIGGLLVLMCFMVLAYLPLILLGVVDSTKKAPTSCWEMKEVQGVVIKFNNCTGATEQVEVKKESPAPAKP